MLNQKICTGCELISRNKIWCPSCDSVLDETQAKSFDHFRKREKRPLLISIVGILGMILASIRIIVTFFTITLLSAKFLLYIIIGILLFYLYYCFFKGKTWTWYVSVIGNLITIPFTLFLLFHNPDKLILIIALNLIPIFWTLYLIISIKVKAFFNVLQMLNIIYYCKSCEKNFHHSAIRVGMYCPLCKSSLQKIDFIENITRSHLLFETLNYLNRISDNIYINRNCISIDLLNNLERELQNINKFKLS